MSLSELFLQVKICKFVGGEMGRCWSKGTIKKIYVNTGNLVDKFA